MVDRNYKEAARFVCAKCGKRAYRKNLPRGQAQPVCLACQGPRKRGGKR